MGRRVEREEVIIPWMVTHSTETTNRMQVPADGKTPYERWKGKIFKRHLVEFGENVLYIMPKSDGRDKYDSRWEEGIWLGVDEESGEYRVSDGGDE